MKTNEFEKIIDAVVTYKSSLTLPALNAVTGKGSTACIAFNPSNIKQAFIKSKAATLVNLGFNSKEGLRLWYDFLGGCIMRGDSTGLAEVRNTIKVLYQDCSIEQMGALNWLTEEDGIDEETFMYAERLRNFDWFYGFKDMMTREQHRWYKDTEKALETEAVDNVHKTTLLNMWIKYRKDAINGKTVAVPYTSPNEISNILL